ncbi:hypothetical protein GBAR_LOCUS1736 [Geodia barretti]|jgi:hypothetical protein|uniref:Uncharacterized protein n=1 Tax=Geodia barretti TaxID=519541 RepID=A0AA35VWN8_GEOBA|nr:hypothetical protein GBAR_LOCUS1736 [Geodia barretti]
MDGLQNGMTNGAMKGISRELVAVVRSNSLCPKHNLVLRVHTPSSFKESGGLDIHYEIQSEVLDEASTSMSKPQHIAGVPDIAVKTTSGDLIAVGENRNTESWRGVRQRDESEIGQLLIYLLGVQIKSIQLLRHRSYQPPTPVLGLFMDGLEVYSIG